VPLFAITLENAGAANWAPTRKQVLTTDGNQIHGAWRFAQPRFAAADVHAVRFRFAAVVLPGAGGDSTAVDVNDACLPGVRFMPACWHFRLLRQVSCRAFPHKTWPVVELRRALLNQDGGYAAVCMMAYHRQPQNGVGIGNKPCGLLHFCCCCFWALHGRLCSFAGGNRAGASFSCSDVVV